MLCQFWPFLDIGIGLVKTELMDCLKQPVIYAWIIETIRIFPSHRQISSSRQDFEAPLPLRYPSPPPPLQYGYPFLSPYHPRYLETWSPSSVYTKRSILLDLPVLSSNNSICHGGKKNDKM